MNKKSTSFCLLALCMILCLSSIPVVSASPLVSASILDWMTNQNDWFLITITVGYCFQLGFFNIYTYNDGGLAFYQCLNQYVKTVRFL